MRRCSPEIPNMARFYRWDRLKSITLISLFLLGGSGCFSAQQPEVAPTGTTSGSAYEAITGESAEDEKSHWDSLLNRSHYVYGVEAASFIKEQIGRVPPGRALEIAVSEGRNAVFLAQRGFEVDGVDISEVALRKAQRLAREHGVSIHTIASDIRKFSIPKETYDLIFFTSFFDRSTLPAIKRGIKKGGWLICQLYTLDQLKNSEGRNLRRDWLVRKGELKELFNDFEIIHYEETNDGKDALAGLVARKR